MNPLKLIVAVGALALAAPASAGFIFSNVTYTTNSITFTIDGNMTGYASPGDSSQFSIRMPGDIYSGPANGFTPNMWDASPFDNFTFSGGNLYDDTATVPYSWNAFSGNLSTAFSTLNTVTVSWTQNWLNAAANDPTLVFVWGNGHDSSLYTVLATYEANSGAVPAPATPALLALGMFALGFRLRRRG